MIVRLFNNYSDNNEVHKSISILREMDCNIYEECSIQTPTIIIDIEQNNPNVVLNANYCYIPFWNRYYYITDSSIYNGNLVRLSLKVDVLMSFWNDFANSPCIAKRSTSHPNPHIPDTYEVYKNQSVFKRRKDTNKFTPTSTGGCYILTIGGK